MKIDTVYQEKKDCTGCSRCVLACKCNAIKMIADGEGFLYPYIDQNKCVNCGLCIKVCPNYESYRVEESKEQCYGVIANDKRILDNSTSGGFFTILSDWFLANDGYVCGCVMSKNLKAMHVVSNDYRYRDNMRDSKYIQSDIGDIYEEIENIISSGKKVLFTGTPCQSAAVKSFFRNHNNFELLYTCDIVCHGVPSPKVFSEHLRYIEEKFGTNIKHVFFRRKKYGWSKECRRVLELVTDNGPVYDEDFYRLYFNYNLLLRPSCSNCNFARVKKDTDFTIGDFWGVENVMPDFPNKDGVSLVILHSQRAKKVFKELNGITAVECPIEKGIANNPRLSSSNHTNERRELFYRDFQKFGYKFALKIHSNPSRLNMLKRKFAWFLCRK